MPDLKSLIYKYKPTRWLTSLMLCAVAALQVYSATITEREVSSMLKRLDDELEKRDYYIEGRQQVIDSLRGVIASPKVEKSTRLSTLLRLGDEYNSFNTDSALIFYTQGHQLALESGLDSIDMRFKLRMVTYLPLLAFTEDALRQFEAIDVNNLPEGLKEEYYDAQRQMYFYIAAFFVNYPEVYEEYMSKTKDAQVKLIPYLDETSPRFKLNQGEFFFYHQEYSKAKAVLTDLLEQIPEEDNLYARACHFLADIAKARGEHHEYTYYLALSAIADIRGATLEVTSLQELGRIMYLNNDIERAHEYLSLALRNAVDCHAPLRILQSSQVLPIIERAHRVEIENSRHRIYTAVFVMAILLMILGVTLILLRRKIQQMNRLANRLEEANETKDVYITQFLNLCSIYMDKLSQFNKVVNRKISAGKVDDLYKITKSGKFIEEQSKEFYDVFDDAFLHIYPTFVADVNALLRPEEQIQLRDGEKLNTDLRILAFMRLGIEESARIAQMLNYSVYTIYTYRNKLKNRAVSREDFEENVMKIKSIS